MTKEMHEINSNATDFVAELIDYIFTYPDDDYMTMECLCRKLHKHGLIDKEDGEWVADTPQTEVEEVCDKADRNCNDCWKQLHCRAKDTPQTEVYDYKGNGKWERSE